MPHQANALARARAFAEPLHRRRNAGHRREHAGARRCGGRHPQVHGRLGGHAGGQLPGLRLPAPEQAAGGDRQGVRRELRRAGGRNHQAGARAAADARGRGRRRSWWTTRKLQTENVRKMLLAFSRDLRVVMLRLASRLQTLRWYAACKRRGAAERRARGAASVRAAGQPPGHLAGQVGDGGPGVPLPRAGDLQAGRPPARREARRARGLRRAVARAARIGAQGAGHPGQRARPAQAHLQHRQEDARQVAGLRPGVRHPGAARDRARGQGLLCGAGLGARAVRAHRRGVRRLHRQAQGQRLPVAAHDRARRRPAGAIEIQIRTQAMHDHAEHGVAAHWAYKEAGSKGYAGVSASGEYDAKIAVLRQLLAWERDLSGGGEPGPVRRPHLCADARCRHRRIAAGRDAGRLRLHACTPAWATAAAARASTARWCR